MKIPNRKLTVLTNVFLSLIICAVLAISFLPEKIVPIYGGEKLSAIYNGNRENKNVSLMFNVYENTQIVNRIIDCLDGNGVKATFFVGGCWADDNAETLLRIVNCGHEIGNHGYFHKDHAKLDYEGNFQEISLTSIIVESLCGVKPTLFAPPSGSFSDVTLESAFDNGYKVIMWSKDTIDWRDSDREKLFTRATKNLTNGDLVLMHPKQHTLDVLPEIIAYYKSMGFSIVTVGNNIL